MIDLKKIVAIDVHTHAEISCRQPFDDYRSDLDEAFIKYFKASKRLTIQETCDYYRSLNIAFVMFTVDAEYEVGRKRVPNEEVAEEAMKNSDIMIPFASIDPHKGKMGLREAKKLLADYPIRGFKFHPTAQGFYPNDRMAWPLYEIIAAAGLPMLFHSGHSGLGTGARAGGGLRLEYSNPMYLDDVAIAFPDNPIIIAHPSWPWQDEALCVALHKPNVYIDLSGWSPKYFPPQLVQYANTQLKSKMLFGTDFPLITPERWMNDFETAGFRDEVKPLIMKENAVQMLQLNKT
ncbi:MAG: amidohydrolase family protein [Chitinophagales bacterium]